MKQKDTRKKYAAPKLRTFGDIGEITEHNNHNRFTDTPIGTQVSVGYSPAAE